MSDLNKLKKMNKLSKLSKVILIIVLISPVIFFGYKYINFRISENKNNISINNNYVKNISQSNFNLESDLILAVKESSEAYKSVIIGSVENVDDTKYTYSISSISGDRYARADYFMFPGSDYYIRSVYSIYTNEIYSITLIHKDDLKTWVDFDDLQSKYAKQLDNNNISSGILTELIEMQKQKKFLTN